MSVVSLSSLRTNDGDLRLLHGTTDQNELGIARHGLGMNGFSYLTALRSVAHYYAMTAAKHEGGDGLLVEVLVDPDRLRADRASMDNPLHHYRDQWAQSEKEWHRKIEDGTIPYPEPDDWETSLRVTGCVRHDGPIPLERIRSIGPPESVPRWNDSPSKSNESKSSSSINLGQ